MLDNMSAEYQDNFFKGGIHFMFVVLSSQERSLRNVYRLAQKYPDAEHRQKVLDFTSAIRWRLKMAVSLLELANTPYSSCLEDKVVTLLSLLNKIEGEV